MTTPLIVPSLDDLRTIIREEIRAAVTAAPAPSTEPEWLNREDAAKLLDVHPDTVRRLPGLPSYRVGKRRRYRRSDIIAYMQRAA